MSSEKFEDNIETKVYKPKEKQKKTLSFIWVLPLIILSILGWIAYESYTKKGTNITVTFKSAEGLKEGVTPLEYKGLQLGKVTKIHINDLNSVKVNILVNSDVADFIAIEGSSFWIKKPTISLTKVSGLGTLLSGNKIEVLPKYNDLKKYENVKPKYEFEGLDTKPSLETNGNGYYVSILSNRADFVEIETPIFYNKFQIGEIVSKVFKDEQVYLKAYIYDRYNHLINSSSKFYMNKALNVNFGPGGVKLEVSSFYSALIGGINVLTLEKDAKKMQEDESYILYENKEELEEKTFLNLKFDTANGIGERTSIMYKGIEVGKIKEVHLNNNSVIAKAFVYKDYEYLLSENSKFYLNSVEVGIDGVKNLNTVVSGNFISVDYKKGKAKYFFVIQNKKINKEDDDLIITLNSKRLNSITKDSKIYYKNIPIGEVLDYTLSDDFKKVKISVLIKSKYKSLVNDKTMFYDISSRLIELKNFDFNINFSGVKPFLNGGISLINIGDYKSTTKTFKLYETYKEVDELKKLKTKGFVIDVYFDNSFELKAKQTINYKNQEIGYIKNIDFGEKESKVKMFVYNKYKKYIDKNSRFYKKNPIKFDASLGGVVFELDNLSSLLNGSINLDNSSKQKFSGYQIYASYDDMINSVNTLNVTFDDVEGLKTQFSKLVYKGVEVGKVTNISLTNKNKVLVKIQIFKDYDKFAKKGTVFYLKKPKISLNEIQNIGSTIMPVNIGVIPSFNKATNNRFVGLDSLEDVHANESGEILKVVSIEPTKINEEAPIYYKNVQIGKVNKIKLSFDGSKTYIYCLIYDKYKHFVRTNSTFHDISGFKMKFSLFSGTEIKTNTFTSLIKGGLMVVTPYDYDEVATTKNSFVLQKELKDGWENINPSIKIFD
ncbi:MlaD family protein [Arcobacter arenosus]|uniref:MCE family protein n=1 Tax=Arcobacter arenosus TaxID=2576037 RepID=A0A5R8XZJ8_9BACT|nr:MlaD family protein [Arcobacter arenosus]TLP37078.1 MCE family protein [Arcobacter arenosus]